MSLSKPIKRVVLSLVFLAAVFQGLSGDTRAKTSPMLPNARGSGLIGLPSQQLQPQIVPPCLPAISDEDGIAGTNLSTRVTFNCTSEANTGFSWATSSNDAQVKQIAAVTNACAENIVERTPYPRSIVSIPTVFSILNGEWSPNQDGVWSKPVRPIRDVEFDRSRIVRQWRNLRIGLRSRSFLQPAQWLGEQMPLPTWLVEDRDSGIQTTYKAFVTNQLEYTWQAASYNLTPNGRTWDFANNRPGDAYTLPAYAVKLTIACGHEWSLKWDEMQLLSNGRPGWIQRSVPWQPLNVSRPDFPYSFGLQTRSVSVVRDTQGVISPEARPGIWVPVIEVQTVQQ
jgi:hypothetical protein